MFVLINPINRGVYSSEFLVRGTWSLFHVMQSNDIPPIILHLSIIFRMPFYFWFLVKHILPVIECNISSFSFTFLK